MANKCIMQNETLINLGKAKLKEYLSQCTEGQQLLFKCMYSKDTSLPIDKVVDNMSPEKIDWAMTQCENTLKKKK